MPHGTNRPCVTKLRRRIEALLEKSLSVTDEASAAMIQNALYSISQETLEWLIGATLAPRQGRELTEREAAAKQAYAAALELECRRSGLTVRGIPDVSELISLLAIRQESENDLLLCISGSRTILQGLEPTAAEFAALQKSRSALEAQYQRAGFSSQAEFERWHGKATGSRKAARRGKPRTVS